MATWIDLDAELDTWASSGEVATFWWRDDDAVDVTGALDRLLSVSAANDAAVSIAVIPADATPTLLKNAVWPVGTSLLQHGLSHRNHAPDGEKKAEFGNHRDLDQMNRDIQAGRNILDGVSRFFAAFVPPWNRISPAVSDSLSSHGFRGVSTHGPRRQRYQIGDLVQSNTHVDPIDWRGNRGYIGDDAALNQVVAHLNARRTGSVDAGEPTGLLTHHLVHDAGCWSFVEKLTAAISAHRSARWLTAEEVFAA